MDVSLKLEVVSDNTNDEERSWDLARRTIASNTFPSVLFVPSVPSSSCASSLGSLKI